jgi:hypothetical protein
VRLVTLGTALHRTRTLTNSGLIGSSRSASVLLGTMCSSGTNVQVDSAV